MYQTVTTMHVHFMTASGNPPAATFQENLFVGPPLYGEFDEEGCLKRRANSDMEHFVYIDIGTL